MQVNDFCFKRSGDPGRKKTTFSASGSVWRTTRGLGGTSRADRMGTIGPTALRRGKFRESFDMFHARKTLTYLKHSETAWNVSSNVFKNVFHYVPPSFELTVFNVKRMCFELLHYICFFPNPFRRFEENAIN